MRRKRCRGLYRFGDRVLDRLFHSTRRSSTSFRLDLNSTLRSRHCMSRRYSMSGGEKEVQVYSAVYQLGQEGSQVWLCKWKKRGRSQEACHQWAWACVDQIVGCRTRRLGPGQSLRPRSPLHPVSAVSLLNRYISPWKSRRSIQEDLRRRETPYRLVRLTALGICLPQDADTPIEGRIALRRLRRISSHCTWTKWINHSQQDKARRTGKICYTYYACSIASTLLDNSCIATID